jgi:hypothetical protein
VTQVKGEATAFQQGSATAPFSSVMAGWRANHCTMGYGLIGEDLISLAVLPRVPISMVTRCGQAAFHG